MFWSRKSRFGLQTSNIWRLKLVSQLTDLDFIFLSHFKPRLEIKHARPRVDHGSDRSQEAILIVPQTCCESEWLSITESILSLDCIDLALTWFSHNYEQHKKVVRFLLLTSHEGRTVHFFSPIKTSHSSSSCACSFCLHQFTIFQSIKFSFILVTWRTFQLLVRSACRHSPITVSLCKCPFRSTLISETNSKTFFSFQQRSIALDNLSLARLHNRSSVAINCYYNLLHALCLQLMELPASVPNSMASRLMPIHKTAITSSSARTEPWRWRPARMDCCSMERVAFIIIATTTGLSIAESANMIVRISSLLHCTTVD